MKENQSFIRQHEQKDCGVACLAMILKTYQTDVSFSELRELSGTNLEGTTALGLKKTLEAFNFKCDAFKADESVWQNNELKFPLIAHLVVDNQYTHYVVIYGIKKNKLIIGDPAQGKVEKTIEEFNQEWTGTLLFATPNEDYQPVQRKKYRLSSFMPLVMQQKKLLSLIVILSICITMLGIASSYYFQSIIDFLVPRQEINLLNIISIGMITIYVVRTVFEYLRNLLMTKLGQKMSLTIILDYLKHVLRLPMSFFNTRKSGDIISRFLDANKIIDALANISLSMILDLGMVIIIGITLLAQNSTLFLIALGTLPFYMVAILAFVKKSDRANQEEMSASSELNSNIIEAFNGVETIKAYNGEQVVDDKVTELFEKALNKSYDNNKLNNLQQTSKQLIQLISSVLILWIGSYYVMNTTISLGQLITFNALLVFFTEPLQNIINLQAKLQTAKVATERLSEVLSIEREQSHNETKVEADAFNEDIAINNVSFSYKMGTQTLDNINFKIAAKSKVALLGLSGSGKSTLAKILVNFFEPSTGNVSYGHYKSSDINNSQLRNHVTYIPQESFFFRGTILENLTFGLDVIPTLEEIKEVCDRVKLSDFIQQQELQLGTMLEEGASNLSGGQKQRLAIARALLKKSNVFILDEATSGLDALIEKEITDYLLSLNQKTVIFISHHLPVAKKCDQILVLDKGKLVEQGSHSELIKQEQLYHQLCNI
ncbi:peptide cleavage/export ABC transporter [Holzapfeliella floricola]|uniref:Peptide cleavage/export ABC transporter n=1 Tax=Holzapfeliella floricola DSM 23037 = JCM 16512 TaxID=1423744 RepID=A0A0R2DW28_9LACO|nr:peptide cleavage/export ABC transporter [Holzapfeliella floricola]KRN04828.1 hypothetical protein FC86_GL001185 [Holzapfeliella floricola DSM 23037 = JCM 16512]